MYWLSLFIYVLKDRFLIEWKCFFKIVLDKIVICFRVRVFNVYRSNFVFVKFMDGCNCFFGLKGVNIVFIVN